MLLRGAMEIWYRSREALTPLTPSSRDRNVRWISFCDSKVKPFLITEKQTPRSGTTVKIFLLLKSYVPVIVKSQPKMPDLFDLIYSANFVSGNYFPIAVVGSKYFDICLTSQNTSVAF